MSEMASPLMADEEDVLFVALGKYLKESETLLTWVLQNYVGMRTICILHVHQPPKRMPMSIMGADVSISLLNEGQLRANCHNERQEMQKLLDKYISICVAAGARAVKLSIEMDSVEKGLVHLLFEHRVKWFVMGAAANKSYSKRMKKPKSKKAVHIIREAPSSCQIWFVCKGILICTRKCKSGKVELAGMSPSSRASTYAESVMSPLSFPATPRTESVKSPSFFASPYTETMNSLRPICVRAVANVQKPPPRPTTFDYQSRIRHENVFEETYSRSSFSDNYGTSPRRASHISTSASNSDLIDNLNFISHTDTHLKYGSHQRNNGESMECNLYGELEHFLEKRGSSRRELYKDSIRCSKNVDALQRVKTIESLYTSELRRRQEIEEELARGKEEADKMKCQVDQLKEKLRVVYERKSSMECQVENSYKMVDELEENMFSAIDLLKRYKMEKNKLQVERDNALQEAEQQRKIQVEKASKSRVFVLEFSFLEIEEATRNFSEAVKMSEGRYGCVYRGNLRHTQVAIKMLNRNSCLKRPVDFQQEVYIRNKLRHPNIVPLIGSCTEAWALIYEYLPDGSLEDRLNCKDNTPPLSWQNRIRIATELCSAIIYFHSQGIVHGDINTTNVFLDAKFVSKLSGFTMPNGVPCIKTELFAQEELNSNSDVYSLGVILLRLLTGRDEVDIFKEVRCALEKGKLEDLLDVSAGEWPFVQAKELAYVAMRCCDVNYRFHPDLVSEVWRVLEPMRVSCCTTLDFYFQV